MHAPVFTFLRSGPILAFWLLANPTNAGQTAGIVHVSPQAPASPKTTTSLLDLPPAIDRWLDFQTATLSARYRVIETSDGRSRPTRSSIVKL
jgi:hypothetical protein